jgi:hypothetical protein
MAADLRCPNCEDNLGKDTENSIVAWCGTCGTRIYNERGYDDMTDQDKEWLKANKPRPRKTLRYSQYR